MSFGMGSSVTGGRKGASGSGQALGQLGPAIQSCSALLVVHESSLVVTHASANAAAFLGFSGELIGASLRALGGDLYLRTRPYLARPLEAAPQAIRCRAGRPLRECDALLHRPRPLQVVIELEPAGPASGVEEALRSAVEPILSARTLAQLCDEAARVLRELTGYDRVLVFRADDGGQGEVVAECRKPSIPSCLGQCFGGAEIPAQAHQSIERGRVLQLVDANEPPVPVLDGGDGSTTEGLDLSGCTWRTMSRTHLDFLERLGVRGALIASLVVGGRLWGLVVGHHRAPRFTHYQIRTAVELLAEAVATRITVLEGWLRQEAEEAARRFEARVIDAIARHGDWTPALTEDSDQLLDALGAAGAVAVCEGRVLKVGRVPPGNAVEAILGWLDRQPWSPVVASTTLVRELSPESSGGSGACGVLAVRLGECPGEYLLWLRPSVSDLGPVVGSAGSSARTSTQLSQVDPAGSGASGPRSRGWTPADRMRARLIAESISDVLHQFRAVRVLIAQAQLAEARSKIGIADQPILIADAAGRVSVTTRAFDRLLSASSDAPETLEDIARHSTEPMLVQRQLRDLILLRKPWRGQIRLRGPEDDPRELLIRADPVLSSPDQVLGYVVILTDISSTLAAYSAGERLQASLGAPGSPLRLTQGVVESPALAEVMAAVLGEAHSAARGIAGVDGADEAHALAVGVQGSVARAAELLQRLATYSQRPSPSSGDGAFCPEVD